MDLSVERDREVFDEGAAGDVLGNSRLPGVTIASGTKDEAKIAPRAGDLEVLPRILCIAELLRKVSRVRGPERDDDALLVVEVEARTQGEEFEDNMQDFPIAVDMAQDQADVVRECPDVDVARRSPRAKHADHGVGGNNEEQRRQWTALSDPSRGSEDVLDETTKAHEVLAILIESLNRGYHGARDADVQ